MNVKKPEIQPILPTKEMKEKYEKLKKLNEKASSKFAFKQPIKKPSSPKLKILIEKHSKDPEVINHFTCCHLCYALFLVLKNFGLKMQDHLLLGGEHAQKIWPTALSPKRRLSMKKLKDITPEDKKEIVLNDPKFGMFSLFKYHLKRGYLNEQLKKQNKVFFHESLMKKLLP